MSKDVENINLTRFTPKVNTYKNLAYTHNTRIKVNNNCMKQFLLELKNGKGRT